MARFQIFIPKSEQVPLNDLQPQQPLEAVGLADMIANAAGQNSGGPEDQTGILISWPNAPGSAETGYKPDRQTWIPAVPREGLEAKRYWVGIWNDKPPTPKDLKRPYQYSGRFVDMNDGKEWLIPRASELPHQMILADDGSWKFEVQRQFHDMSNESQRWVSLLAEADENTTFLWPDLINFVVPALKMNYMLTDEVVSHMGLFDQPRLIRSLYAICGVEVGGE